METAEIRCVARLWLQTMGGAPPPRKTDFEIASAQRQGRGMWDALVD